MQRLVSPLLMSNVQSYDGHRAIWTKLIAKQTQDVAFDMPRERYVDDIASNKAIEHNAPTATQPR